MADVDEFFRFFLDKASADLQRTFTFEFTRMVTCRTYGDLDVGVDKGNSPIRTMSPYDLRARNMSATKSTVVNAAIITMLKRERTVRCPECDGAALRHTCVKYYPPFTFFFDGSNAAKHPQNIPFPPRITIQDEPYILHAKIQSTFKEGLHFYTQCSIPLPDGNMFLGDIDNLSGKMEVLDADDGIPETLAKQPDCNIIVCYRRQRNPV